METFFSDVKHSIRMFLRSPGFTITAVAALALGIGGTTAIFSIVNTVLLKPLGIPDPNRLVVLTVTPVDDNAASGARFVYWRSQSDVVQDVSAYFTAVTNYTGGQMVEQWKYTRGFCEFLSLLLDTHITRALLHAGRGFAERSAGGVDQPGSLEAAFRE
jgi:hypothetical protein